jgi:hypothetical protein
MVRRLTRRKKRERKEANHKRVMAVYEPALLPVSAKNLICHQAGAERKPENGALSFTRIGSRVMMSHTEGPFTDSRGIEYKRSGDGSLRVVNKPRSRVKRLREARA